MRALRRIFGACLFALLFLSCGAAPSVKVARVTRRAEAELRVRPDARERPELELRLRYRNGSALYGYGALSLWAQPDSDEIHVVALVDAPARRARWQQCRQAQLDIDGEALPFAARYVGRAMNGAVYDAVRLELGIEAVRRMSKAHDLTATVCGDRVALSSAQRRSLVRFVSVFDRLAAPVRPEEEPIFREVGPKLELLPCEEGDPGPYPA